MLLKDSIIKTDFFKEKYHEEDGKEVFKDGDRWLLTAGNLILATITLEKYINFDTFKVSFEELGIANNAVAYPKEWQNKRTLQDAITAISAHLKRA